MAKMTKEKILDYFNEINLMYNNGAMHDFLSRTLDELLEDRPEIVRCKDCWYWIPGTIDEHDNFIPPRCKINNGPWSASEYCSRATRR
jgi:hypothetical protein